MGNVNFVAWHDRTQSAHKVQTDEFAVQGYRTSSLCIYGPISDARYAAVMIKRSVVVAEHQIFGHSAGDYQSAFNSMSAQGFGPYIVSATGSADDPRFAVCFRPMLPTPLTRHGMTGAEFQAQNFQVMLNGGILVWADAYGDAGDLRYIAVWHPNDTNIGWGCNSGNTTDVLNDDPAVTQAIFKAQTSAGARLAHIAPTPSGGYMTLYEDTKIGSWLALSEMSSADYQNAFNTHTQQGLFPLRVTSTATPSGTKFAAIFAAQEDVVPRTIRFSQTTPNVPAIEEVLTQLIASIDVRGMSVAITSGPRLVYTKGVSFGEPDYPQTLPETPFRQASVSKLLCAVALYALLQEGHDFNSDPLMNGPLSRKMQDILGVNPPPGMTQNPNWGKVELRHLLESTSAINFNVPWASINAVAAFPGTQLPATAGQLLSWGSVQNFTHTPGDPNNVIYGNDGYMVLGEVVRRLAGTPDLATAIRTLVCEPLGMKNTFGSRSLVQNLSPNETRYYNRLYQLDSGKVSLLPLTVGPSLLSADQPLVATQYGNWWEYETGQGCGGMSSAVVDIARIVAMFNSGGPHPVLSPEALEALLTNAQNATNNLHGPNPPNEVHGYHGLDSCVASGGARHAQKGGWIPSHDCMVDFMTNGGFGVVAQFNGNTRKDTSFQVGGDTVDYLSKLHDLAKSTDWGDIDLFNSEYGMESLTMVEFKLVEMPPMSASTTQSRAQTRSREIDSMTHAASNGGRTRIIHPDLPLSPGPIILTP